MNRLLTLASCSFLISACDTNFTQYLATTDQQESIEQQLIEAQYEYDKGNYDDALSAALDALAVNPNDEESSVTVGYIYLSKAGLDAFSLASRLIDNGESNQNTDNKTASLFSTIADVIGVTNTELQTLTTETQEVAGVSIYIPDTAGNVRETEESQIVANFNNAIEYICPFVDESAKLLDGDDANDERHNETNCPPTAYERNFKGKANFALALAHLGEAITFYSVLFYTDADQTNPNIERAVEGIGDSTNNASAYLTQIDALSTAIDGIFPTGTDDSMINAVFNNLEVTSRAFGAIAGLPDDVTKSITDAITDVKEKASTISGANANATAMKQKLTNDLSKKLARQIESLPAGSAEIDDICTQFEEITDGDSSVRTPDECQ
ncbi:hypothetical protein [Pseudobacteriovorax antillogorgiicola]|uniref:Tetratricopeptide repeat-containing protein n=1 Tax=Pseudobacteriovorax antillogorgiicola TaxID=1513793 RepID=A0A1Y6CJE2_9BACT|nr:hypothetical protein [Pseudobacteriovorax antillogorgiicola]TCS46695.1 hypothetical protein EDD56_12371 [Pseudobacteriovorax antillogorgiicola]SMF66826.1 hypothetical protein SAMN06296036_12371 [Pseudobacteriovorax antillogorgiicola]